MARNRVAREAGPLEGTLPLLDPLLGHANANVTLSVYAHLFAQREHGEVARQALQASYEAMAEARSR